MAMTTLPIIAVRISFSSTHHDCMRIYENDVSCGSAPDMAGRGNARRPVPMSLSAYHRRSHSLPRPPLPRRIKPAQGIDPPPSPRRAPFSSLSGRGNTQTFCPSCRRHRGRERAQAPTSPTPSPATSSRGSDNIHREEAPSMWFALSRPRDRNPGLPR